MIKNNTNNISLKKVYKQELNNLYEKLYYLTKPNIINFELYTNYNIEELIISLKAKELLEGKYKIIIDNNILNSFFFSKDKEYKMVIYKDYNNKQIMTFYKDYISLKNYYLQKNKIENKIKLVINKLYNKEAGN